MMTSKDMMMSEKEMMMKEAEMKKMKKRKAVEMAMMLIKKGGKNGKK